MIGKFQIEMLWSVLLSLKQVPATSTSRSCRTESHHAINPLSFRGELQSPCWLPFSRDSRLLFVAMLPACCLLERPSYATHGHFPMQTQRCYLPRYFDFAPLAITPEVQLLLLLRKGIHDTLGILVCGDGFVPKIKLISPSFHTLSGVQMPSISVCKVGPERRRLSITVLQG